MTQHLVRIIGAHSSAVTGAAIVHDQLAQRLGDHLPAGTRLDDSRGATSILKRLAGPIGAERADVTILTSTPMPVAPRSSTIIPVVYDVRWRWTRGKLARWYRLADLRATGWRAPHVLTISHTVAEQLRALRVVDPDELTVLDLGPGQMQAQAHGAITDRGDSVVLIGAAPHKRNELAARLLTSLPRFRRHGTVICVSVSTETQHILQQEMRAEQLEFHTGLGTDELAATLRRSRAYLTLGTSEGFGFPYVEAAHQGCDVVAIDQALTRELLGDDAQLLSGRQPSAEDLDAALTAWDPERVARLQARALARDWNRAAEQVAGVVERFAR